MPQTSPRPPHDSRPVPLSHRRSLYGNYRGRCIYLFTLNVEGRKPLLGTLQGSMAEEAYVQPSALGKEVLWLLEGIPAYQKQKAAEKSRKTGTECRREIRVMASQLMPDHMHIILFVEQEMDISVGKVLQGFMIACTHACYSLGIYAEGTTHSLWERGYNDTRLTGKDQLQAMKEYLRDNPRRLFVRRAHPEYYTVTRNVLFKGKECDMVGNRALLEKTLHAVHVRSRFSPEERRAYMNDCVIAARQGKVLIGAFISDYEKSVRDEALQESLPVIQLSSTPFFDYYKPYGALFDACAAGLLLMLYPVSLSSVKPSAYMPSSNPYWQTQRRISRAECVALNTLAEEIAGL